MSTGKPARAAGLLVRRGAAFLPHFVFPFACGALSLLWCSAVWAVVIGYHDVSDSVKTAGWVCDTAGASPLRVHLYAQTATGLKLLDSQWADRRRGDLQGVCGGLNHAFRFADYAATAAGVALYGTRDPVPMHVYVDAPAGSILVGGSPRSVVFAAAGLWDPGLKSGRWRTDYDNRDVARSRRRCCWAIVFSRPRSRMDTPLFPGAASIR